MDPSGRVVNTPAFLTMRVPRFPLTAPVMVESEVRSARRWSAYRPSA